MSTREPYHAELADEGRAPSGSETAAQTKYTGHMPVYKEGDARSSGTYTSHAKSGTGTKGTGASVGDRAEEGVRYAADTGAKAVDTGTRAAAGLGEAGVRGAQAAASTASRGAQAAVDTASRGAQAATDATYRGAQGIGETAYQAARAGTDVAAKGVDTAVRGATAIGQTARDLTMRGAIAASDAASGAWRKTLETGQLAMNEAQATASRAADVQSRMFGTAPLQQKAHAESIASLKRDQMTPLQQHLEFFDRDKNGIIYPHETYAGFRAIGFSRTISFLATLLIHFWFSYPTQNSIFPDLFFWSIRIENAHKLKHGSDAEVYTHDGYFDPRFFDKMFEEHGRNGKMNFKDVWNLTESKREALDFFGWSASKLEWFFTYWSLRDANGEISKQDVLGMYDGKVLYELEDRYAKMKMRRKLD